MKSREAIEALEDMTAFGWEVRIYYRGRTFEVFFRKGDRGCSASGFPLRSAIGKLEQVVEAERYEHRKPMPLPG